MKRLEGQIKRKANALNVHVGADRLCQNLASNADSDVLDMPKNIDFHTKEVQSVDDYLTIE